MKLTAYTDYTLRKLVYVAVNDGRSTTIAEIANAYRISEAQLMKIVHQLGVAGDIATARGRNGGIVPCFSDPESCAINSACLLKGIVDEALNTFLIVLDRCTLADLITPRRQPPPARIASLVSGSLNRAGTVPDLAGQPTSVFRT